jgi:hypothetical protein
MYVPSAHDGFEGFLSQFASVIAYDGWGGQGTQAPRGSTGANGRDGFASGGDANNVGGKAHIIWNTTNTASCAVTGNGDTWSATSGNQLSSTIASPVTYSLSCDQGALTGSVFILPIPGWREF